MLTSLDMSWFTENSPPLHLIESSCKQIQSLSLQRRKSKPKRISLLKLKQYAHIFFELTVTSADMLDTVQLQAKIVD